MIFRVGLLLSELGNVFFFRFTEQLYLMILLTTKQ